jgi:hypothetical protein
MVPLDAVAQKITSTQLRRWRNIAFAALLAVIGLFPPGPQPPRMQEAGSLATAQPRDRERQTTKIESNPAQERTRASDVRRRAIAKLKHAAEGSKDPLATATPPAEASAPATSAATSPAETSAPATIVAEAPLPCLKPRDADRRRKVIALLKQAVAKTARRAPAATAVIPPKPMLKPWQVAGRPQGAAHRPPRAGNRRIARAPPDAGGSIEDLQRQLAARDAVIADLLRRVEQLEQGIVLTAAQLDQAVAGQAGPPPGGPSVGTAAAAASAEQTVAADQGQQAPPPPGQFEVDEDSVERALERTLVQEGVLLLPFGQGEIEPSFSYMRQEGDVPTFVTQNGDTFVGEQKVRRNEFQSVTAVRVGLPFDAQLEVTVPYEYVDQSNVTTIGDVPIDDSDHSGAGIGDIRLGAAKTLLRENGGWWPDLVGRVYWDTDSGKSSNNGVVLGGGFNEVGGSLNVVKRQDPLAFVGSVSYEKAFEHDNMEPGDELGFSIGALLAASPETSLRFGLNQSFVDNLKVDGETINGSDQVMGTLTVGAAMILGRNVLLDVSGEVGLTDDAPDYAARASMPIRFDLPVY